jgi:TrmH family RNA methyltransferase
MYTWVVKESRKFYQKTAAGEAALLSRGVQTVASVRFSPFICRGAGVLQNIRVVLVNTSHPGNIGGAARAMKNMGLTRLVLVDPQEFPSGKAEARAAGASDVLANAQVVATLEEALVGCSLVFGTSARDRHIPWPLLDPRESAGKCLEQAEQGGEVALVFGREYAGLTNEELQRCHFHVHIPSDPEFGSLNLAAAVQVLTYEVRMGWLAAQGKPTKMDKQEANADINAQPVTADELEQFYGHLEQTLIEIGFLIPERPRHLMPRLRRLFGRSEVNKLEMNILRGILTETQKVARGEPHKRRGEDV